MTKPGLYLLLAVSLIVGGCNNTPSEVTSDMIHFPKPGETEEDGPVIDFEGTEFDFGTIAEGEQINFIYKFKNTGEKPLVLSQVTANCGCTVPQTWPREPIGPGEKGEISVSFDSNGREGTQTKVISVVCNTRPATHTLLLKGTVRGPQSK